MPHLPQPSTTGSLRSRKFDSKKALVVYRHYELLQHPTSADGSDDAAAARLPTATTTTTSLVTTNNASSLLTTSNTTSKGVPSSDLLAATLLSHNPHIPTVSTGVEKEEEEEHHLQAALVSNAHVVIPTPDASGAFHEFSLYYTPGYIKPEDLVAGNAQIEDCMGCLYNADAQDMAFCEGIVELDHDVNKGKLALVDQLEHFMEKLERIVMAPGAPDNLDFPTLLSSFLEEKSTQDYDESFLECVFSYWKERRFEQNQGLPLRPQIKADEIGPDSDPYICFRRREVKVLRKARRSDNQSVEKLKRLRDELVRAREILDLVALRESARKEILELEERLFEQRIKIRRIKKKFGIAHVEPTSKSLSINNGFGSSQGLVKKSKRSEKDPKQLKISMHRSGDDEAALYRRVPVEVEARPHVASIPVINQDSVMVYLKRKREEDRMSGWKDTTFRRPSTSLYPDYWNPGYGRVSFRRRVGRGGRLFVDRRYSHEESWRSGRVDRRCLTYPHDVDFSYPMSPLSDSEGANGDGDYCMREIERLDLSFEHDAGFLTPDSSFDTVCLDDDLNDFCRDVIGHSLEPKSFTLLQPKPVYPHSIHPTVLIGAPKPTFVPRPEIVTILPPSLATALIPSSQKPEVPSRSTETQPSPTAKKASKSSSESSRKKAALDPRAAMVRNMMQQSQMQAQKSQQQIQQQKSDLMKDSPVDGASSRLFPPSLPAQPTYPLPEQSTGRQAAGYSASGSKKEGRS